MTNIVTSVTDQLSSTTEEGVQTSANDDGLGFTLLDSGAREYFITSFLANRK